MRECWVNVYVLPSGHQVYGLNELTPDAAESALRNARQAIGRLPAYRLHVRLKPEPVRREGVTHLEWERFMGRV